MNTKKLLAALALVIGATAFAADELTSDQEKIAKAGPRKMKLMIASFGTIESMTQIDQWLGEQLQPKQNIENPPSLSEAEALKNPNLDRDVVRLNWNTRKLEYIRESNALAQENLHNKQMLTSLRTKVLTNDATRYIPLAKDYLQAELSRKAGSLIQIVDRSNADMAMVEQSLNGNDSSSVAGATCILTVAMGDREEDSKTVTVNAKGTQIKTTTYTQPYVGKIRDLEGNVLLAFNGTAEYSTKINNVVKSSASDPARKLTESVCAKIADEVTAFFTTKLEFKVKTPEGVDPDEVVVTVDGKSVDTEDGVRVLAVEHAVVGSVDGCKKVKRLISIDENTPVKTVKLVFKKVVVDVEDED